MYSDTITLFNYHEKTGTWHPIILYGVDLGATVASSSNARTDKRDADSTILLMNCNPDKSIYDVEGRLKSYTPPKEYADCADPENRFTLAPECDFFVEGAIEIGETFYIVSSGGIRIAVSQGDNLIYREAILPTLESYKDADYESGLYHAMNEINDGVYMVKSSQFFGLIPHFEIGGR